MILSLPLRRALALALPLLMALALYSAIVRPAWRLLAGNQATVEQLTEVLARYRDRAASLPELIARATALRQSGVPTDGYLVGDTPALAGATLQEHLKALIGQNQGHLVSVQILPPEAEGKRRRLTARGEMTLDVGSIEHVLYTLESETPYLFVDNLAIHAISVAGRTQAKVDPMLDVHFEVSGYLRGQE
jgi:general secretion pathway protein M